MNDKERLANWVAETWCFWSLPHRDIHTCSCICRLERGHKGRHRCELQVADARS